MQRLLKSGLPTSIISFVLLFIGIRFILGNEISLRNIITFIVFSFLVGILTSVLVVFKFKIAYLSFWMGSAFGFFIMYRSFLKDTSGWGDLIGVISLLICSLIGLGVGLLGQLVYYFFQKYNKTS